MHNIVYKQLSYFLTALLMASCASSPKEKPKISYQDSAKTNYKNGKKEFDSGNSLKAENYFKFVKNRYPYSTYATMADLMLAECSLERDRYIEAADGYNNFIKLHPKHKKVPYAMYRIGYCYFQRIPDDWWFAPPAHERDQSETVKAIHALQQYLQSFPQDEHAKEGKRILDEARLQMAKRAHYAMHFYIDRDRFRGVLWRADEILKDYDDLGFTEEVMYLKAEALHKLEDDVGARETLTKLLTMYPQGEFLKRAKKLLTQLATPKPNQDSKKVTQPSGTP